jgi:hypothetical protein
MTDAREFGSNDGRQHGAEIVPLPWVARRRSRAAAGQPESELRDPDDYAVSTRTLILVGAFLALFVIVSVWLLDTMRKNALIEECLMAGRKNCTPVVVPPRER